MTDVLTRQEAISDYIDRILADVPAEEETASVRLHRDLWKAVRAALQADAEHPTNETLKRLGAFYRACKVGKHQATNWAHLSATVEVLDAAGRREAADTLIWLAWHQVNGQARHDEFYRLILDDEAAAEARADRAEAALQPFAKVAASFQAHPGWDHDGYVLCANPVTLTLEPRDLLKPVGQFVGPRRLAGRAGMLRGALMDPHEMGPVGPAGLVLLTLMDVDCEAAGVVDGPDERREDEGAGHETSPSIANPRIAPPRAACFSSHRPSCAAATGVRFAVG